MKDLSFPPYVSPFLIPNGHIDTMVPHFLRKVRDVDYVRERIETSDGDFLDLDWSADRKSKKLVIFSHGLEGSSRAKYIQGIIPHFRSAGFDALAWNFRFCSGEPNRTARFYHSGSTDDLDTVVRHVLKKYDYESLHMVGFSMGGNLTLKYLGENPAALPKEIKTAVVFSVPLDLKSSVRKMSGLMGRVYTKKFLLTLNQKLKQKKDLLEKMGIDLKGAHKIWDFRTWDNRFTAPIHGFKNADDYYEKASARPFLKNIRVPTLIVNAWNDPFLGPECFPVEELRRHDYVRLITPRLGGHVGFSGKTLYWSEQLALGFSQ